MTAALAIIAAHPGPASAGTLVREPLGVAASASSGLGPGDIQAAYSLPSTGAGGQTIAVVSSYDDPAAATDLNKYLSTFGLPKCTQASRCFREVNQSGKARPLPGSDPTGGNFITESALGTEIARGVCGSCKILLVVANSPDNADLATAVATASRLGAQVIDTSFSPTEQPGDSLYESDFTRPGSVVVAASGDTGYTGSVTFPASFPGVIAVGGTQLTLNKKGGYGGETVWNANGNSTGSGCSQYLSAPPWQAAFAKSVGCGSMRSVADISAVANPGVLVYITNILGTPGGAWYEFGGTSLSSPIIAGAIGLAGGGSGESAQLLYTRARVDPKAFHDITRGSTIGCNHQPICAARRGYDGPTGLGTPDGLAAFLPAGGAIDPRHPYIEVSTPGQVRASPSWVVDVTVKDDNGFAVAGRASLRLGGRLLATRRVTLRPLASPRISFTITGRYRALVQSLQTVAVQAKLVLHGKTGRSVTITKRLRLEAP